MKVRITAIVAVLVASLGLVTMATGATANRNYGAIVTEEGLGGRAPIAPWRLLRGRR